MLFSEGVAVDFLKVDLFYVFAFMLEPSNIDLVAWDDFEPLFLPVSDHFCFEVSVNIFF